MIAESAKLEIAKVAHEANRRWCQINGDHSLPVWEECDIAHQTGLIRGVQFHIDNPDASETASHDNWMRQKLADGWVWGPRLDRENKIHPNLVPFDSLPKYQQAKDILFKNIVKSLLWTFEG